MKYTEDQIRKWCEDAATRWRKDYPIKVDSTKSEYIIKRPEGIPDWVQIGVKCEFKRVNLTPHVGYLCGYDNDADADFPYQDETGKYYSSAEPILANEKPVPRDDEMVACWDDGDESYSVSAVHDIDMKMYGHVTSYHGQLDPRIEALAKEVVYK